MKNILTGLVLLQAILVVFAQESELYMVRPKIRPGPQNFNAPLMSNSNTSNPHHD